MEPLARQAVTVRGAVQGVGFRPFVHALASRLGLAGFVRNEAGAVLIEVEGARADVAAFVAALAREAPPGVRVREARAEARPARGERPPFRIEPSAPGAHAADADVAIAPDAATCDACLRELFDPRDRRHRYAFVTCAWCGPRLTVARDAPYDRERTTMAAFAMCGACRREYEDPRDRRFHAQSLACPACGPALALRDARGAPVAGDPLEGAAARLRAGQVVAVKGLGGYHLACDARDEGAVAALRRRKHRDAKPFAVMVADLAAARALLGDAAIAPAEAALLTSPARPIVLLARGAAAVAPAVAPDSALLGVMLAYAPVHHLLFDALGRDRCALVMTSGNRADEPIAHDDADALGRLAGIADAFLAHDRAVSARCDDSVARVIDGAPAVLRRARGYAPDSLALPAPLARPTLALGGQLKNAFALGAGDRAVPGQHIGDLFERRALAAFDDALARYARLLRAAPRRLVHDLHPDYATTQWAHARARADAGLELLAVQHHHAHFASCLAEHGLRGPAIGVVFDGAGAGTDGAVWGGEFLVGGCARARRAAHLAYVALPGGERGIREPWRVALAHLVAARREDALARTGAARAAPPEAQRVVRAMIARGVNAPMTSSVGRLFDAVAALAGVHAARVDFEAQAAVRLEALATGYAARGADEPGYPVALRGRAPIVIDAAPLVSAAADDAARGEDPARIAWRLHAGLAAMVAAVCTRLRDELGCASPPRVALCGGVFANALLVALCARALTRAGFAVIRNHLVPPGDGGLALGQLAVAAARDAETSVTTIANHEERAG